MGKNKWADRNAVECCICGKTFIDRNAFAVHIIRLNKLTNDKTHEEYLKAAWAYVSQEKKIFNKYFKDYLSQQA